MAARDMWSRLKSGRPSALALALLGSVLLHLLVLFGQKINLDLPPTDLARLEARLVRSAPDSRPGAAPEAPPPKPKAKPKEVPQAPKVESEEPPTQEVPEVQPEPEKVAEAEPEPAPETPAAEPPKAVGQQWPRSGRIRYHLYGGEARDPAASSSAELRWEIDPEGRYRMSLESRDAKPFPSMPWFTISLSYASQGRMVDGLFQPTRYEEAISVFQHIVVNFDWDKKTVDFAGHLLPLQPGTLDYLTVIMQSGDPGFVERGLISVATGRGLRQYRFEASPEQELAMPFGATWKVRQLAGVTGNNDVRVWVATEKFNLPVKIKFVINKVNYYLVASEVLVARDAVADQAVPTLNIPAPGERQN